MPKETLVEVVDEVTLNGVTAEVPSATIVRAHPKRVKVANIWVDNTGKAGEYIRLQMADGRSFLWSGNFDEVDENTSLTDPKWVSE